MSTNIPAAMVKELREATGAGVLDCRKALEQTGGDMEKAALILREKGAVAAAKKAERVAEEGRIEGYIHPGNRVGVLLELNCESDFVARTAAFQELAHEIALHVAFANPRWVKAEEVPASVVDAQKSEYRQVAIAEGKNETVADRIVEGRLKKFYQDNCLMEQPYVRDDKITIQQLVHTAVGQMGENIVVRRFIRYELGQELEGD